MKKIFVIISAIVTGAIGLSVFLPGATEASLTAN